MPEIDHRKIVPRITSHGTRRGAPPYAELQVVSNFSFLRGASHPQELIHRAAELGYQAIALTDVHSLAGVVRAHGAAKEAGVAHQVGRRRCNG